MIQQVIRFSPLLWLAFLSTSLLTAFAATSNSFTSLPPGYNWHYNPENGHYYALSSTLEVDWKTWDEASAIAESLGGYLATITDEPEDRFVAWTVLDTSEPLSAWLGLRAENNLWKWVTGEYFSYSDWEMDTNNHYPHPGYAVYDQYDQWMNRYHYWYAGPRSERRPFVIELEQIAIPPTPTPTATLTPTATSTPAPQFPYTHPVTVYTNPEDTITDLDSGDINGDGLKDIVFSSSRFNKIHWFRNDGHVPVRWVEYSIPTELLSITSIDLGDVDRDGDLDIVAGNAYSARILWLENDGSLEPNWTYHYIETGFNDNAQVLVADLDKDIHPDIVVGSSQSGSVMWFEQDRASGVWTKTSILDGFYNTGRMEAADLDNDGDIDIVIGNSKGRESAIIEQTGSNPVTWTGHIVNLRNLSNPLTIYDYDKDGYLDLLFARGNVIAQISSSRISLAQWSEKTIFESSNSFFNALAGDINLDGKDDLLTSNTQVHAWLNQDESWQNSLVLFTSQNKNVSILLEDLDGDLDLDIISAHSGTVYFHPNSINLAPTPTPTAPSLNTPRPTFTPTATFTPAPTMTPTPTYIPTPAPEPPFNSNLRVLVENINRIYSLGAGDLDQDGNVDVIASWNHAQIWLQNKGEKHAAAFQPHVISDWQERAQYPFVLDVNGDGLNDIVSVHSNAIYYNTGDMPPQFRQQPLFTEIFSPFLISGYALLSDDTSLSKLITYHNRNDQTGSEMYYHEYDVARNSWNSIKIYNHEMEQWGLASKDLTGDGIKDLALSFQYSGVYLLEGFGTDWITHTISENYFGSTSIVDMDGDGDMDIFVSGYALPIISNDMIYVWFENTDGKGQNWREHPLLSVEQHNLFHHHLVDLDNDRDLDILATQPYEVYWLENLGNNRNWQRKTLYYSESYYDNQPIYPVDLDQDGDLDVIVPSDGYYTIYWIENETTNPPIPTPTPPGTKVTDWFWN